LFTIADLWKIMSDLQGEDVPDLSEVIKILSKSEKTKSSTLFSNTIDQAAFLTDDYYRLKDFLIDWYSSLKTLTSSQTKVSDPFSLPDTHLDELFKSFGYDYSTDLTIGTGVTINENKVNFFLDLVNLYKIKGTPRAMVEVHQYYGLTEIDLYEFWIEKDDDGDLVFRGEVVDGTSGPKDKTSISIPFDTLVEGDPHWMLTEEQILQLYETNKINLPSKSPYFALQPTYETGATSAVLQRVVQDQYHIWDTDTEWKDDGKVPDDLKNAGISSVGYFGALIELYLSCVYVFNRIYDTGKTADNFVCYDGTNTDYIDILNEFEDLVTAVLPRDEARIAIAHYFDTFTRAKSTNFLQTRSDAATYLNLINSQLKDDLDTLFSDEERGHDLLVSLLLDLGDWIKDNLGQSFLNIAFLILGFDAFSSKLKQAIDFFKPYRARLLTIELIKIKNNYRLLNSIRVEDSLSPLVIEETIVDFETANSISCCDETSCSFYSRETYDCGSYYDIGAVWDDDSPDIEYTDKIYDSLNCMSDATTIIYYIIDGTSVGSYELVSVHTEYTMGSFDDSTAVIDSTSEIIFVLQTGGFEDFDENGSFDCVSGFDLCEIYVEQVSLPP